MKERVKIRDDTLSFLCNTDTNGTCNFKRTGEDLAADYSNPRGGRNLAVFKRVALSK
jgi:hypothetical protein